MQSPLSLLAQSMQDYRKEAPIMLGYSAWLLLPFAAFVLLSLLPTHFSVQIGLFLITIVELFFVIWVTIIISLYAYAHAQGHEKNIGAFSTKARSLMIPVLSVAILQLLVVLGGFFLLIIPMFIFAIWFGLAQYSAIFDNKRGLEAMSASRDLTRGRFWRSAGYLILGPLIIMLAYSVILSLFIALLAAVQGLNPTEVLTGPIPLWVDILESLGEILVLPLMMIYFTRVYLELKQTPAPTGNLDKESKIA